MRATRSRWAGVRHPGFGGALAVACAAGGCAAGADEHGGAGAEPPPANAAAQWLVQVNEEVGLDFVHDAGLDGSFFMPQMTTAGAAVLDYDGDGDLDLYLVNGASANRLLQRGPGPTYRDVTDLSGLGDTGYGNGVAVGDFDNDGDPDVYVTNYARDALYRNEGDGTFTEVTTQAGAVNDQWACSASFFDYDRDGFLDLFVANYVHYPLARACADGAGRPDYCGPKASPPTIDVLFRNLGDGTFEDASVSAGITAHAGRGLGVLCDDFDGDGLPDVYVANDGEPNFLWINNGDGTFTESAMILGVAVNIFAAGEASMGVTAGDADGDGDIDLFMTHLDGESNTFYRNDGTGSFDDASAACGLGAPSLPLTGFGTAFVDLDNDGALDVAVVNGRVKRGRTPPESETDPMASYAEPNLLFRNDGAGKFTGACDVARAFCDPVEVSRGLVVADLDDDGGVDLLVTGSQAPARLYRNVAPGRGHWLIVRAIDPRLNRDAYGARITVTAAGRRLVRTVNPAYSYACSNDPRAHFGLGDAAAVDEIEVVWPDGRVEQFGPHRADQVLTLKRGG